MITSEVTRKVRSCRRRDPSGDFDGVATFKQARPTTRAARDREDVMSASRLLQGAAFALFATLSAGIALTDTAHAQQQQGPIKIGLLVPLTGPLATPGKDMVDGFKLFWEQAKQPGRRPQGRDRHRRHDLQSRPGAHPGTASGAPGEGALPHRPAVRPRGPGRRAGQQGDRCAAGHGYGRRRQRHQVGPHADRRAHRGVREPDRPSVRRLSLQGARRCATSPSSARTTPGATR